MGRISSPGKETKEVSTTPFGEIISRSLAITWRHRFLWLLAFFAGESAVGFSLSTSTNMNTSPTNGPQPTTAVATRDWTTVTTWVGAHVARLAVMALLFLAIVVALFLVSVVANGAVVRASYEFDAERPFSLGQAWNDGLASFWSVLKVKVIAALVTIVIVIVIVIVTAIGVLVGSAAYLVVTGATVGGVTLALLSGLFTLAAVPFSIVFGVVILFAVRGVTLDGLSVSAALSHGFHLIRRRLGRTALLWIIIAALSVVGGLIVGGAALLVGFVLAGIVVAAYLASGIAAAVVIGVLLAICWLGVLVIVSGAIMAFTSTYWTLGYTRLDRDPQPMMEGQPRYV